MKKICVVTATRAEYGLLKNLLKKLYDNENFEVKLVATGMHLSPEFGFTYKEIEKDGFTIDKRIEILLSSDSNIGMLKSTGLAIMSFAEYFEEIKPDMVLLLGDRYEMLAVSICAMNLNIPIAHIHGGEITEGAIDDAIRHSITKMSYIHFTCAEEYRKRVIQLGEEPERVFNVGSLGVENILNTKLMSKSELEESINFKLDKPFAVVTFHPETLGNMSSVDKMKELLNACKENNHIKYIFTKANADSEGRIINKLIDEFVFENGNTIAFNSLGMVRYLSALKYSSMVIGNSSSGIIEAPAFKIPTINIGDRQKGRIQGNTIINCKAEKEEILQGMKLAYSNEFIESIKDVENPFGDGHASDKIIYELEKVLLNNIDLKKKFYNIDFRCN